MFGGNLTKIIASTSDLYAVPITIPERIRWAWNFFFSEIELSESQPDLHAQAGDQNAEQEFIEE